MKNIVWPLWKRALFHLDPEGAHNRVLSAIQFAGGTSIGRAALRLVFPSTEDPIECFGVQFKNRIGLAAGYDKNAKGWQGLSCLGFGHLEIGTVTPYLQIGNPRPRVHRLVDNHALINQMGFPNEGSKVVANRLLDAREILGKQNIRIAVNIGKQATTPLRRAAEDYSFLIERFAPLADYLVINISSPNTPNLRLLQRRDRLNNLLGRLDNVRKNQEFKLGRRVPLLVKLSPDMRKGELKESLDSILENSIDGIIPTNTTITRSFIGPEEERNLQGGLSGAPLRDLSMRVLKTIRQHVGESFPIIASGGIMTPEDAQERLKAGANLVQLFTGLVYEGPSLPTRIGKVLLTK